MRNLITIFYSSERLAASSGTLGHINPIIRDAVIGIKSGLLFSESV